MIGYADQEEYDDAKLEYKLDDMKAAKMEETCPWCEIGHLKPIRIGWSACDHCGSDFKD